jgi:zona occludens toxin
MIICYMGTPGSGKSYEAALRIIENLKKGRKVYVHLDGIDLKECREILRVYTGLYGSIDEKLIYLGKDDLENFTDTIEENSFIIIDEAHKFISNREWNTGKNKKFADWCSTHRHVGCDVLLITQHLDKLDSHIRTLIEWTYKFRKVNFFGSLVQSKYMEYVYSQDDVQGECLSRKTKTYDRKIFPVYKSYVGKQIKEKGIMKGTNIFKHPVFYGLGVVVAVFCYLLFQSPTLKGDLFGAKKVQAAKIPETKAVSYLGGVEVPAPVRSAVDVPLVNNVAVIAVAPKKEIVVKPLEISKVENQDISQAPLEGTRKKLVLMREKRAAHESNGVTYLDCADNVCSLRQ